MSVFTVNEPYDSLVRILVELQMKAAKKDLTGIYDAANEIMELLATPVKDKDASN